MTDLIHMHGILHSGDEQRFRVRKTSKYETTDHRARGNIIVARKSKSLIKVKAVPIKRRVPANKYATDTWIRYKYKKAMLEDMSRGSTDDVYVRWVIMIMRVG